MSSNTERDFDEGEEDDFNSNEIVRSEEGRRLVQVDEDNPADTCETFDEQKNKEKKRNQSRKNQQKKEKQEPHSQTYSFGFVSSNAQILTSDETRLGSSARLLKKANMQVDRNQLMFN